MEKREPIAELINRAVADAIGFEFCNWLKRHGSKFFILIGLSGSHSNGAKLRGKIVGVHGFSRAYFSLI
jgi:hypothetical protein